jgi:dUTP pyrophosphatase
LIKEYQKMQVALIKENAVAPKRANRTDAGADLSSCVSAIVPAHGQVCVDTGVAVHFPQNYYGRVAPRSGLAFKNSIDVLAGVIDYGYNDSIKVILFNHSDKDFQVSPGDRIAQLVIESIFIPSDIQIVEYSDLVNNKKDNTRNLDGFGSTGV